MQQWRLHTNFAARRLSRAANNRLFDSPSIIESAPLRATRVAPERDGLLARVPHDAARQLKKVPEGARDKKSEPSKSSFGPARQTRVDQRNRSAPRMCHGDEVWPDLRFDK